jgi:hypothetical protein
MIMEDLKHLYGFQKSRKATMMETVCSHSKFSIYQYPHTLPPPFTLFSCSDYSSTLKIEATCFSETSVFLTELHVIISQKTELFIYRCENLKSYSTVSLLILW